MSASATQSMLPRNHAKKLHDFLLCGFNELFLGLFLLFVVSIPWHNCQAEEHVKRVLILQSYSTDFQWTAESTQGIVDTFAEEAPDVQLRIEFMDTKNFFNPGYLESLANIYKRKYTKAQPDGIIAVDNNALNFVETYASSIFPNVPAVATGINHASPPTGTSPVKSIIAEKANHLATIRQALNFWPKARNLFVIADATPSGKAMQAEVLAIAKDLHNEINITPVPDMTVEQLGHFVSTRHPSDIIYLLPFIRSINGTTYAQGDVERYLASVSTTPVLASWSFQMNTGVIGGQVISGHGLGEQAARSMLNLLQNKPLPKLQNGAENHINTYDYAVVNRFDVNPSLLPRNSVFINRSPGYIEQHLKALIPAITVIVILLIFVFFLNKNLRKHKSLNTRAGQLMVMDQELIETQRELVTTLGEIIEVRSQETGHHVKRVAKLARMLGRKVGLNEHQLNQLEAAAALHDIGKIGIPELVLHKPGKLTQEEFETIKKHTEIGRSILGGSSLELMEIGCKIAYQHHERWDGSGYPCHKKGEDISIYARITALADVYDALSSNRCYQVAWTEDRALDYIKKERGRSFDPKLVDIFLDNLPEVRAIRSRFPNRANVAQRNHHTEPLEQIYAI